jgi:HK97 family phage major capsid protein
VVRDIARLEREQKEVKLALETGGSPGKKGFAFSSRNSASRDTPEYENFFRYATKGKQADDLNFKTLRTDSESQGGYLIPQVMDAQIRKNITEVSPVRQHARVRIAHSKTMDVPRRLSLPIGQFEGEAEAGPTDQSVYGSEQVTLYRQTVSIPVTLDMMVSSAFDLEQEIVNDCAESFAQGEGKNFVSSNGRKCPQGFMTDTRSVGVTTSTSAAILWDDLSKLSGSMKMGMQPWFFCNRKTLAYLQSLKSTIGVPIWQPVSGNQPATIFGWPYDSSMIDMDDISLGSGAKPVAFADLNRGYEIFDMIRLNFIRDDITAANQAITKYTIRRYLTGRVLIPEAIGVLTLL